MPPINPLRSAAKRMTDQVELAAQGIAERVIDLVVEALDVNALLLRIDVNAVVDQVDVNELMDHVDVNELLNHATSTSS